MKSTPPGALACWIARFARPAPLARRRAGRSSLSKRMLPAGTKRTVLRVSARSVLRQANRYSTSSSVFPATRVYRDRVAGQLRRHHLHESVLQRAVSGARRTGCSLRETARRVCAKVCQDTQRGRAAYPDRGRACVSGRRRREQRAKDRTPR